MLERLRRGGRAVQCTGLENRRAQALAGSNPAPSALRGLPGLWSWGVFSSSRRTRVGLRVHVVKGSNRAARVGVRASDPPALPRANDAKRRQSRPNAVRTLLSFRAGPVGGFERRRPTRPSTCLTRAMRRSSRRRLSVSSANWSKRHQPSNACAPRGTTSPPRASGGSSTPPITHRTLPSICSTDYGKPDCPSATIESRHRRSESPEHDNLGGGRSFTASLD